MYKAAQKCFVRSYLLSKVAIYPPYFGDARCCVSTQSRRDVIIIEKGPSTRGDMEYLR